MRTIKFRGRDSNGYTIYGGISRNGKAIVLDDAGSRALVDPESVVQLVGYDSNGAEVYEGDTLIDAYGNQYEVQFYPMGVNDDDCIDLADSAKLNLTLKEDQS